MNTTQGPAPIEFWFDFASGYAYFAALEIEALAGRNGRSVLWRPFTLGAAFKVTGAQGLSRTPLKGEYARRDWQRLARLKGVVFNLPERHRDRRSRCDRTGGLVAAGHGSRLGAGRNQ